MTAAEAFSIILLVASSASLDSPASDVDSLALVMNNLAELGNTELNYVSDFIIDDQRRVGSL